MLSGEADAPSDLAFAVHALFPASIHSIAERLSRLARFRRSRTAGRSIEIALTFREGQQRARQHDGEPDKAEPEHLKSSARNERTYSREHHENAEHERTQVQTSARVRRLHHVGLALVQPSLHIIEQLLLAF